MGANVAERRMGVAAALVAIAATASLALAAGPTPIAWRPVTKSPQPMVTEASLAPFQSVCGQNDFALSQVAARSAARQLGGGALLPADEIAFELRANGDPHVWPRGFSLAGADLDDADVAARMTRWRDGAASFGQRRCGVARLASGGSTVIAAVAVDALADMDPLPTTARVGQWLTLQATMLVPASEAKVILLGPRGAPRTVVASLSGSTIRSSFSVDQAGPWLVQVLATVATGPRPVLEAMVFAGAAPPDRFVRASAPGEEASAGPGDDADAMFRMINASRASEGLRALARDAELDKLAAAHSIRMQASKLVGHDVGDGDPTERVRAAGIRARVAGENVATAGSRENAHRALWASPSHRGNLLTPYFSRVGVAVVAGERGGVWVTELFAD